jgi:hypothetical protein
MQKLSLKETLLLAASLGFVLLWLLDYSKGIPLKTNYFWIMLALGCLFYFQYSKNQRLDKK